MLSPYSRFNIRGALLFKCDKTWYSKSMVSKSRVWPISSNPTFALISLYTYHIYNSLCVQRKPIRFHGIPIYSNDCDDSDKEYGYFYDLDINDNTILIEKIQLCENPQNNIINNYYDRYYIYNNHDQKKDDDIIPKYNDDDYNEKYSDLYFIINVTFITGTGIILLYLTLK